MTIGLDDHYANRKKCSRRLAVMIEKPRATITVIFQVVLITITRRITSISIGIAGTNVSHTRGHSVEKAVVLGPGTDVCVMLSKDSGKPNAIPNRQG